MNARSAFSPLWVSSPPRQKDQRYTNLIIYKLDKELACYGVQIIEIALS